jgi:hypothetical protein
MIETLGAQLINPRVGSRTLFLSRGTSMRVRRFLAMQTQPTHTQRIVDGATPGRVDGPCATSGAAALDASRNRTSRQQTARHSTSAQGRHRRAHHWICQRTPARHYRRHSQGTERHRDAIAAEVLNMVRAGELIKGPDSHTLSERVTSAAHPSR